MQRFLSSKNKTKGTLQADSASIKKTRYSRVNSCNAKYTGKLDQALGYFLATVGTSDDYVVRTVLVAGRDGACLFLKTLCDPEAVQSALREIHCHDFAQLKEQKVLAKYLVDRVLSGAETTFSTNLFDMKEAIVAGDLVIIVDGVSPAVIIRAKHVEHRALDEPKFETSVRGSQIGFVENITTNISILRDGFMTETLVVKKLHVGSRNRKEVAVVYLHDVANPNLVRTVVDRIKTIEIDTVSQGTDIELRIIGHKWTMFPLTRAVQRVDSTVKEISQGKVVVIVDGDPTVLIVPVTIQDFFQTEEDYSRSSFEATFIRWIRIVAFIFALYLPALYISFVDYNPELLPKVLGLQIAKSREGVPFPAIFEVIMMQVVIEILREATLRMPRQLGQTLGIVGGLVVGEATVQAGLVSNVLIIVVSLTAISIFVSPSYEFGMVLRLGNFVMFTSAAICGLYAIVIVSIVILYELSSLESFGVPYLSPFDGRYIRDGIVDGMFRIPLTLLERFRTAHILPQTTRIGRGFR